MARAVFFECRLVTEDGVMYTGLGWTEDQATKAAKKRAEKKSGKRFKPESYKNVEVRKLKGPKPRSLGEPPKG
jgi:hypothetical protein